jgi:nucleoporin NDC1
MYRPTALSHLVTASLQEDDFGVVQQELPKILEAFVTYLRALEALIDELNQAGPDAQAAVLEVVAPVNSGASRCARRCGSVRDARTALQTGLSRMVDVLGPHLGAFRFPPAVAKRLQLAVDWGARQREEQ